MIYLASPLFDTEQYRMAHRYGATKYWVNRLQQQTQEWIYSPILHYYVSANEFNLPKDYLYWRNINHQAIDLSSALWVLMLPGWEKSQGIKDEISYARRKGKRIIYIDIENERMLDVLIEIENIEF